MIQKVLEELVQASPSHPYTSFIVVKISYFNIQCSLIYQPIALVISCVIVSYLQV